MSQLNLHRIARHLTHHLRWVIRTVQLAIFTIAGVLAFLLRFDLSMPAHYWPQVLASLYVWIPVKVLVFRSLGLERGWRRYASVRHGVRVAARNLVGSVLASLALLWIVPKGFPRSIYILDFLLCLGMTAGVRLAVVIAVEFSRLPNLTAGKRALIYGAGDAGVALLGEIQRNPALSYEIVGFIDDDPAKAGRSEERRVGKECR